MTIGGLPHTQLNSDKKVFNAAFYNITDDVLKLWAVFADHPCDLTALFKTILGNNAKKVKFT